MSRTVITLSKNKENPKEKTIHLQLSKISDYAVIKFQGKLIKNLFLDFFGDVYMPDYMYADVSILRYTDNKYKLSVYYGIYKGKKDIYAYRKKLNFYNNSFFIDGENVKVVSGIKSASTRDSLTVNAFYKELFTAEYNHYASLIKDFEESFCDYDTFVENRESYIMLVDAFVT